jgi:NADPH-dependent 2,4-dienoyl-CoA reductase/sulfur reductase-like enzyme/rhodanese-related sulfurtransferase
MKILIIGGVAGGASAAARARRLCESAEIVILEKGPDVSFANCGLPYHVGGEIPDRRQLLLQTPESLLRRLNLDVRVRHEAVSIDPTSKTVEVKRHCDGDTYRESYDHLIIATGANPLIPPIEGRDREGVFSMRDLQDMDGIIAWRAKSAEPRASGGNRAVIVGAGFIGLEMAEQLHRLGMKVTVVEAADQVLPPLDPEMAALIQTELLANGVAVELSEFVSSIADNPQAAVGDVITKSGKALPADLVILSVGVRPNSAIASAAGVAVGPTGAIVVDEQLRTNVHGIWAVGDVIATPHPVTGQSLIVALGGPANRQGRVVANNIMGQTTVYRGSLGTAIVRVFGLTAALTGAGPKLLARTGRAFQSVYLHPNSHAGYYPGAQPIAMKLTFDPEDGRVLCLQAVGADGVDKRVDVIATAIAGQMTVDDLVDLELCYAPPFGAAKDPVNLAGMVAQNVIRGLVSNADPTALPQGDQFVYLDVRESGERARGALEPSVHIPLGELRQRIAELPRDKTLVVYCQSGQRSYNACRILSQKGFDCLNLSGAYKTWAHVPDRQSAPV